MYLLTLFVHDVVQHRVFQISENVERGVFNVSVFPLGHETRHQPTYPQHMVDDVLQMMELRLQIRGEELGKQCVERRYQIRNRRYVIHRPLGA